MTAARPTPTERVLAAAIYAPIGLGAKVVDELPDAVVKARQQIVFARFIGKMAVEQGVREVRSRWEELSTSAPAAEPAPSDTAPARESADDVTPAGVRSSSDVPTHDALALPDYDQLPAAHIVGKLDGLDAAELDEVEAYETAHRHRRTVLGKISQLRGN